MERVTLNVSEVAKMLGVSNATVYTMVREKQIPHKRVRRVILFNREQVMQWTRGEI